MKLLLFNLQDFFIYPAGAGEIPMPANMSEREWRVWNGHRPAKSLNGVREIAEIINSEYPDIGLFVEVGGATALKFFNQHFLADRHDVYLQAGNSRRGIELGALFRKQAFAQVKQSSYRERPLQAYKKELIYAQEARNILTQLEHEGAQFFTRDVCRFDVYAADSAGPSLVILLVHFKSQRNDRSVDVNGQTRRWMELCEVRSIQQEIYADMGHNIPMIIAGDFNARVSCPPPDSEFRAVKNWDWTDVFDLDELTKEQRYTRIGISGRKQSPAAQLDYVFVNAAMATFLKRGTVRVRRFTDRHGRELGAKVSKRQRSILCSDHFPVVMEFAL